MRTGSILVIARGHVIADACRVAKDHAKRSGLLIEVGVAADLAPIGGGERRLRQIFLNLLSKR